MQRTAAYDALAELETSLIKLQDRVKYYGEALTVETLPGVIEEVGRIKKILDAN